MTDALVSLVLDQLALIVRQQIVPQVKFMAEVGKEVEKLRSNLVVVQAVLKDAQRRQVMQISVRDWLNKLINTYYEIEDVLDEWSTAIARVRMEEYEDDAPKKKVPSSLRSKNCRFNRADQIGFRHAMAVKIKKLNKKLGEIADERKWFNFDTTWGHAEPQRSRTTAFIDETKICGRENDKSNLISKLLLEGNEEDGNFSIISIVGMGGIGKTTLAKQVYNSREIKAHFDERIWICVSEPFEEVRVARAIIEAVDSEGTAPVIVELHNLLQYTSELIEGKKFLLVLDDMWTEDSGLGQLKQALKSAAMGSKILVTTRKDRVAEMMDCNHKIYLSGLAQEDCWSLFSRIAFSGRVVEECEKLKEIGRKIAEECQGLPLAAKTLGSLMRLKKTKEQWQNVLDSKVWKIEQTEREVFAPLLLSYHDLSPPLKRCFSYCAIFPKDFYFERDSLVQLWMAQGYLGFEGITQMEITGREYFEDLAMRSLFVDFAKDENNNIIGCKMHHVVHEFSQFLVKNESIFVELDCARDMLNHKDSDHSNLVRTVLFQSPISSVDLRNLCQRLTGLRSLGLRRCSIEEIPQEIGELIHLRYLDLSYNSLLICLPESISSLFNLQTLNLNSCLSLERLPQSMGKLINLRHLEIDATPELNLVPKGIRRMKFLRTLKEIEIGTGDNEFTIGDLKHLNQLRGCLAIHGIGNVRKVNEARNAEMKNKKHLRRLGLSFDGENGCKTNKQMDEDILEALEPNQTIEELSIIDFRGKNLSPSWLTSMGSLTKLQLFGCSNCKALPCLGRLPSLKLLKIKDLDRVRRVGKEFLEVESENQFLEVDADDVLFPSLRTLWFHGMKMWEEWDGKSGKEGVKIMPCLHSLIIEECPKLKSLPHFVHSVPLKIFEPSP